MILIFQDLQKKENANPDDQIVDIYFYTDGRFLKKITVSKTMPMQFELNIAGANMLTIKTSHRIAQYDKTYTALTDLALETIPNFV